jgi:hypothetical protein
MNYYGTAAYSGMPAAMMDVINVENASPEELIELAEDAGFDLEDYDDEMER